MTYMILAILCAAALGFGVQNDHRWGWLAWPSGAGFAMFFIAAMVHLAASVSQSIISP